MSQIAPRHSWGGTASELQHEATSPQRNGREGLLQVQQLHSTQVTSLFQSTSFGKIGKPNYLRQQRRQLQRNRPKARFRRDCRRNKFNVGGETRRREILFAPDA